MATTKKTDAVETTETAAKTEAKTVKVKVIKAFKDKETGKLHKVGDMLEITAERLAEIKKVGNFVRKA